jgi:hypothetical protein
MGSLVFISSSQIATTPKMTKGNAPTRDGAAQEAHSRLFATDIDTRRGFIEQENIRIFSESPGDENPLELS